ncbi:peptidyl-prolyl cis-trans isomerase FKBP13, chloroplastic [Primulina tabacum]|uniref:peptidyl-prolyl cis-trans isomerase FKBP13, chloroplastic n=1 Tax=Primulina tabacum TaxID=48773 RepID=UPI003F591B69
MNTLPFSIWAYNPKTNAATGICRKKLYNFKSSGVKLQIQQNTATSASISRREAAFGIGFCFGSFLQFLNPQQDSAAAKEAASPPCEFTAASSGLEYCDKVIGTGPEPVKGQLIKAHYVGKLENGKVFDSSYDRGKPLTFRVGVGEVIKGWDEGILGGDGIPAMSAGGKRKLRIPPALGYGIRGAGCRGGSCIIPPDSVLLFDVEFVGKA